MRRNLISSSSSFSLTSLLSIVLSTIFVSLSAIQSGIGIAQADSLIATIPVGAYPQGIAYDSANGDLYVTNAGDNTVSVISGQTNTVVGSPITVGNDPFGIALDFANGNLYVTNADSNTVSAISGQTNKVVGIPIHVGSLPDGIAYDTAN